MKKFLGVLAFCLCALAVPVQADWEVVAFESITVTTDTAVTLTTTTVPSSSRTNSVRAFMTVESANVRWITGAGNTATSSNGHLAINNSNVTVTGRQNLLDFNLIGLGSSPSTLNISYEKNK